MSEVPVSANPESIINRLGAVCLADVPPERRRRDWGEWCLDRRTRELILPGRYEVDLDRFLTAGACLDWVAQVARKRWATDAVVAGLVRALDDVLDPQAHLCSGGMNGASCSRRLTPADVRRLVREAPKAGRS